MQFQQFHSHTIIVIHPGSLNLRIGRASDMKPLTVLHAIARRCLPNGTRYRDPFLPPRVEIVRIICYFVVQFLGSFRFADTGNWRGTISSLAYITILFAIGWNQTLCYSTPTNCSFQSTITAWGFREQWGWMGESWRGCGCWQWCKCVDLRLPFFVVQFFFVDTSYESSWGF